MIFNSLMEDTIEVGNHTQTSVDRKVFVGQKPKGLANYACVCRDWQAIIEPCNFRRLILEQDQVQALRTIHERRRSLVQNIWLRVELAPWENPGLGSHGSERQDKNAAIFKEMVTELFEVLVKWPTSTSGIRLEVSAHAPTDSLHNHYGFHVGDSRGLIQPYRREKPWDLHILSQVIRDLDLPDSRWRGQSILDIYPGDWQLPNLPIVKELRIQRHTRRTIAPGTLSHIVQHLTKLERLHLEHWRAGDLSGQNYLDQGKPLPNRERTVEGIWLTKQQTGHCNLLRKVPDSVKEISLFEETADYDCWLRPRPGALPRRFLSIKHQRRLAQSLFERSLKLEKISVAFQVDADDFFYAHYKASSAAGTPAVWSDMTSICLTTIAFDPGYEHAELYANELLASAATAAMAMPNLRDMEIWNVTESESNGKMAGVFRYRQSSLDHVSVASINWLGNFDVRFSEHTIQAWERVAEQHTGTRLIVDPHEVKDDRSQQLKRQGDGIEWLDLRSQNQLLTPLSLFQMRNELQTDTERGLVNWLAMNESRESGRPWVWLP